MAERASSGTDGGVPPVYRRSAGGAGDTRALLETEWLLTNGAGGYAMGTALGARMRRYHGLLVAHAPGRVERVLGLAAISERVEGLDAAGNGFDEDLSAFLFASETAGEPVLHPRGDRGLVLFEKGVVCRWVYRLSECGVEVSKDLLLIRGEPACLVRYRVRSIGPAGGSVRGRLVLRPLVAVRDHHEILRSTDGEGSFEVGAGPARSGVIVKRDGVALSIDASAGEFTESRQWWYNFFYTRDLERGQAHIEDLFSPGEFSWDFVAGPSGESITLRAGFVPGAILDFDDAARGERERVSSTLRPLTRPSGLPAGAVRAIAGLADAADAFVARVRDAGDGAGGAASVIAGYPWFSDWGRDTMICLPGLLLETGRHAEALGALSRFARASRNGIIPNLFNGRTGEPEYNTVDAPLWFIIAACRYLRASGDRGGFEAELRPACMDVVMSYRRGTDFNIGMDPADHLICAGSEATQLTWMDARRDGVVFTARHGKPVEVNALWCSGVAMLGRALRGGGDSCLAADLGSLAEAACASFRASFWNEIAGCCYDVLAPVPGGGWRPMAEIRPNQVFAASLPHAPLRGDRARAMLRVVEERLLTARGLRTLDPADARYRGRFTGSLFERDAAYHNGTAWPWLLGPYAEAVMRVEGFSAESCARACGALESMIEEVDGPCVGQLAEVYDGDGSDESPRAPGGCPAQAWSVAELLRVYLMAVRGRDDTED